MLRAGGRMVYSTCTFAPDENEGSISRFLVRHPEFHIVKVPMPEGFEGGRPEWAELRTVAGDAGADGQYGVCSAGMQQDSPAQDLTHTMRIWPHKVHGEGHFLAVLEKAGEKYEGAAPRSLYGIERGISEKEYGEFLDFQKEFLKDKLQGVFLQPDSKRGSKTFLFGERIFAVSAIK